MSVNSSSATNKTLGMYDCADVYDILFIAIAYTVAKVFVMFPLCIYVLRLAYQQWRQQRSLKATSHSDYFTIHVAAMELVSEVGWGLLSFGAFTHFTKVAVVGFNVFLIIFPGQTLFQVLTCLERYLAVVHPITYRGLKQTGGIRIRNTCTACVWLLSVGWCTSTALVLSLVSFLFFCVFVISLVIVTFCSVSVLCVLIRPGPGDGVKDRERVDQIKKKAFNTIAGIMGSLWLLFIGILVSVGLSVTSVLTFQVYCEVVVSAMWFNVPASLVLLVLFLQRAGKLTFCSSNPK